MPRRALAVAAAVLAAGVASVVVGAPPDDVAVVDEVAERYIPPVGDLVVVFDIGEVDQFVVEATARAATASGGSAAPGRTGSLGMREIRRNGTVVHAPPAGYLTPMVYSSLPADPIGRVMGPDVAAVLGPGKAVMHEITAAITGAQVGDVVILQDAAGVPRSIEIVGIRPESQIGAAELVFTFDVANALGATWNTRVVMHDVDRSTVDAALAAEGLIGRPNTRVYRSWDPQSPDSILSTVRTKEALGEPWYRFEPDGSISMHPTWIATNLAPSREVLNGSIPIRARCHVEIVDDLRAALAEVAAAGLAAEIHVNNANAYGGCYGGARFSRLTGDGQIGFLSRHSYGMALDTNTTTNCFGCVPQMNCDVVRIFRKHGFAWGGNFRRPDGMHFEWVGERRDQWQYPSNYCPNLPGGLTEGVGDGGVPELGVAVLTVDPDGHAGHQH